MAIDLNLNLDPYQIFNDVFGPGKPNPNDQMAGQNASTLKFDADQFRQKMNMANEFGINKLSMLGVGNSGAASYPTYTESGGGNSIGFQYHDSVKVDPRDDEMKGNDVKISAANVRTAEANAKIAESDALIRSRAALSTGRPPAARISNDKADSILRTVKTPTGVPFKLANENVLPEQYNHGEAFTTLINSGLDPRLALSLSGVELTNPTSWLTPLIEWNHQRHDPYYRFGDAKTMSDYAKEHPWRTLLGW